MILRGFGWKRDLPDHRDYTMDNEAVKLLVDQFEITIKRQG